MQLTNTLLTLSLATLISSAPVTSPDTSSTDAHKSHAGILRITGLPSSVTASPTYITYAPNFFGDLTLQPTSNKSSAVTWHTVGPRLDLVSTSAPANYAIGLNPPYALPQAQAIVYEAYNGTQGTYVSEAKKGPKGGLEVLNHDKEFGSWRFCESQYGAGLEWETKGFNNSNAGEPFPCYPVGFVLVQ